MPVSIRPNGIVSFNGKADEDGSAALLLLKEKPTADESSAVGWFRRLVGDHMRRVVAASVDGTMPQGTALESCRPDALQALAILSSLPPMEGGEYWTRQYHQAFQLTFIKPKRRS